MIRADCGQIRLRTLILYCLRLYLSGTFNVVSRYGWLLQLPDPVETSTSPKSKCFLLVCRLSLREFNYNLKLFYLSSLLCNLKNKYKNHLKRDIHEIISYTSLFAANQYNIVNILLTLHPSMLRNLPHRYELFTTFCTL